MHRTHHPVPCPCLTWHLSNVRGATHILPELAHERRTSPHLPLGPPFTTLTGLASFHLPVHPPPRAKNTLRPLIENISSPAPLADTPRYTLPQRPLHLVELCGGIATGLEAVLEAGHAVASCTWADIDQDAHTTTSHRLTRLRHRHPNLLPREAIDGWDVRLPRDTRTITLALSTHAFPTGVDLIMTSPPHADPTPPPCT